MTISRDWRERAACKGQDPKLFTFGDSPGSVLKASAETFCTVCPVSQTCLDTAYQVVGAYVVDDLEFTVRGGYLPTRTSGLDKGRPRSTHCARGHELLPRKNRRDRRTCGICTTVNVVQLEGMCRKNLHKMEGDNIYWHDGFQRCAECRRVTNENRRKFGPASREFCRNGHKRTDENTKYLEGGRIRCMTCRQENNKRNKKAARERARARMAA